MENTPKISVIVSAYSVEPFLDHCVRSIASQTYANLEIILVDDGSPDRSGAICDEWAARDERVIVIHQPRLGVSAARNAGLDRATGTFLALVDGDDFLQENMLQVLYDRMTADNTPMAVCNYLQTDPAGNHIGGPNGLHVVDDGCMDRREALSMFNDERYLFAAVVWNKLYRADLFSGIRFPEGKICEDGYIMHEVIGRCDRISIVKDRLYCYTQREGSILHTRMTVQNLTHLEACFRRIRYFDREGFPELCYPATKSMLKEYFWLKKEIPAETPADRKRFREIRCMVQYCCRRYGKDIPKQDLLELNAPRLARFFRKTKQAPGKNP